MTIANRYSVNIGPILSSGNLTAYRYNIGGSITLRVPGLFTDGLTPIPSGDLWEAHNAVDSGSLNGGLTFEGLFNVGTGTYLKCRSFNPSVGVHLDGTVEDLGKPGVSGQFISNGTNHEKAFCMIDINPAIQYLDVIVNPTQLSEGEVPIIFKNEYDNSNGPTTKEWNWRMAWAPIQMSLELARISARASVLAELDRYANKKSHAESTKRV